VDVARLKAEFLHHYYRQHGLPLRNRVFGHVARLGRWGSALAPVSTWLARSGPVRWLNEKLLGIDRRRLPPAFAPRTFVRALAALKDGPGPGPGGRRVLLWPDTFTNHHEPHVGLAAAGLLRRLGCVVGVEAPGGLWCCGRPLISNGLLAEAVRHARHNVGVLHPLAAAGHAVTACEPSCILTVKDDYPALAGADLRAKAEAVAGACRTFEELLDELWPEGGPGLRPGPRAVLVQAHCHQRALVGTGALLRLLRRIPGALVTDLDAGCCGLAGSFGYEKEHYDVSLAVGEQRLFPALRRAAPDAVVVAPGLSCRLQIAHATGRTALHPATLLAPLL
jgi:Fe-S oxidoreductase